MITGGATIVMLALPVFPVPPSIDVACVLLFFIPAVVPVTFTETVQLAVADSVAPESVTWPEPATAAVVPLHVVAKPLGVATTNPAGRVSVNATPVSRSAAFGLVMVNVSEVDPFNGIEAAPKALAIVGGAATVRFAVAVLPVPPFVEVTLPVVFTN
jgi:hypothetical protein